MKFNVWGRETIIRYKRVLHSSDTGLWWYREVCWWCMCISFYNLTVIFHLHKEFKSLATTMDFLRTSVKPNKFELLRSEFNVRKCESSQSRACQTQPSYKQALSSAGLVTTQERIGTTATYKQDNRGSDCYEHFYFVNYTVTFTE